MSSVPEFSRVIDRRKLDRTVQTLRASEAERAALARRFGLVEIDRLEAELELEVVGDTITARGRLAAHWVQSCAVSGDDLPVTVAEDIAFRFVPPVVSAPDEEIELEADELDEIEYDGQAFDLGEAVAQSLSLAIDPYAVGPDAEATRKEAGIKSDDAPSGPLAEALAALKKGD